ncbi:MAG: T9SS type A sorting domain-containing protein [Ignavibacteriales bacterium]|nr:T9SS type A sorting domain-containing protein [Ignavibacteriales bacterium]
MKRIVTACVSVLLMRGDVIAQTTPDSVTVTFRTYKVPGRNVFVPGEFNNWGSNVNGVISPGDASQMSYDSNLEAYVKTYNFQIHDFGREIADSVYQYKFNDGGCSGCWYSDPLNPEQYGPFNNSVLRLTTLFWFQYYPTLAGSTITRITAGLVHANSDSIVSVRLSTGISEDDSLTTADITGSYDRQLRIVDHTLGNPIGRLNFVRLVAENDKGDSVVFKSGGIIVSNLPLPPYARHGVTLPSLESGDSVTFRLRVPGRDYVLLRVASIAQDPKSAPAITMRNGGDGNWWMNVSLDPQTYEYLYELDDGSRIYDPWGRWSGTNGTRFVLGPAGLTADDYVWSSTTYQRSPLNRLVIYELNISEFAGGVLGKSAGQAAFRDLIGLLPHFNSLGVNAIELMPINDFGNIGTSGFSWGYDVSHHFALEPQYGTPRDFKEFVDSAHARGIAVIVDVVFNHLNDPGPLWQMLPNVSTNPYFKSTSDPRPNEDALFFFKDMDHFTPETQEYVYEVLKMWIDEYRVDGFRYDFTQGIGWDVNQPELGILGWANRIAAEYGDNIYQIAEHLPESPALISLSGLTSGWHDSFHDEIFKDLIPSQKPPLSNFPSLVLGLGAYPGNDIPASPGSYADRTQPVNATVNHDEQSLIYELLSFQGVTDTLVALKRDKAYAVFMFASLGIPMLWQGMEFGEPRGWGKAGDPDKLAYRPVRWNLGTTGRGEEHFRWYKTLCYQRRFNPALFDGSLQIVKRYDAQRTLVWGLSDNQSNSQIMVIGNLSDADQTITDVPWLSVGNWYDVFDQTVFDVPSAPVASIPVPGFTMRVFSNKTDSALNIPVSVETEGDRIIPEQFQLHQNYPNPFNPSTTLVYHLPEESFVNLAVYDLLGREITTLVNSVRPPGIHRVRWDGRVQSGSDASTGVYFVRIQAKNFVGVRKIILVR